MLDTEIITSMCCQATHAANDQPVTVRYSSFFVTDHSWFPNDEKAMQIIDRSRCVYSKCLLQFVSAFCTSDVLLTQQVHVDPLFADCGMADSIAKGQDFFQQAQKETKRTSSFFGKSTACTQAVPTIVQGLHACSPQTMFIAFLHMVDAGKRQHEEAAELLEKAANYYKLGKAWKEATEAYRQLAQIQIKQDSKHDAANAYVEGAKCAMKVAPGEAVGLLQIGSAFVYRHGPFEHGSQTAARHSRGAGKAGLKEEAIQFYMQAADPVCH